ncbi:MAG TPA: hypothetical protein VMT61_05185 [Candidatus Binataceae bacterium]|nr:hypothetical protein [Candidatus Binataceae bacterium]
MEKLSPEQRQEIAGKGGKAWWDKLSEEEKRAAIERIQKARRHRRQEGTQPPQSKVKVETKPKTAGKKASRVVKDL